MNKELALRTLAYLKTHYNNNDETIICKEDIDAIDFVLDDNEKLSDLINEYENKGYDIAQERADFLLEIERLNNIINELEKMVNDFDVFKEFTFPLMKRDEEHQVKSSIDYEWRKSIKEPFLDKLKELKENK